MGLVSTQAMRKCSTQRKHGVHIIQDYTAREHSELQELTGSMDHAGPGSKRAKRLSNKPGGWTWPATQALRAMSD